MAMSKAERRRRHEWPEEPGEEFALPIPVVDNHTHLPILDEDGAPTDPDDAGLLEKTPPLTTAEQLARARRAGVRAMITVGCALPDLAGTVTMARAHDHLAAALAIHPNEAPMHAGVREVGPDGLEPREREHYAVPLDDAIARVAELARDESVRAISETGLDFFRTGEGGRPAQEECFRAHIAIAKELDLPMQIHDREAHERTVEILLADGAPERTVFHCFSGDVELARVCAENGWYASVAGHITYPRNTELREAIATMPRELLLVETDAPYLAPAPFRGRPNAPYVMVHTVRYLAEMLGMDLAALCERLDATTTEVYGTW